MISYEKFVVDEATINKYKKAWAKINIAKYIKTNGTEPPISIAESFYRIPSYALEKLKRDEYARYYEKNDGIYDKKTNPITPPNNDIFEDSHIVNVKLKFSVMEDTINSSQTMLLGEV